MNMNKDNIPNLSILSNPTNLDLEKKENNFQNLDLPPHLAQHKAFSKVFKKGQLTFGLIAPFKGYPSTPFPDVEDLGNIAKLSDDLGFSALWVRDVPFFDPNFGDVGQGYDPMITLGYLAGKTQNIALGTAGIITSLRHPIHIAKMASSMDKLTNGRFILGLSTGDRVSEFAPFKADYHHRDKTYRESWEIIKKLTENDFPTYQSEYYGDLVGGIDLYPKPQNPIPMIAIGRARQELKWLANTPDAWIWHGVNPHSTRSIIINQEDLGDGKTWKPFGYANFVELADDPNEPTKLYNNIYLYGGSNTMAEYWAEQKEQGLSHIALNLKPTKKPAEETLHEIAENIINKIS